MNSSVVVDAVGIGGQYRGASDRDYLDLLSSCALVDHSEPVRFEAGDNIGVHLRFPTILDALALLHSV